MSDEIADMPVALLPIDIAVNLIGASKEGACSIDTNDDGKGDTIVSSYKFLEELAKNPDRYADAWKTALVSGGVLTGGTAASMTALSLMAGPLAPVAALAAAIAAPFFGSNRAATLILINTTSGDLKKSEIYQDCGVQSGRSVYQETDIETGSVRSTKQDTIPGYTQLVPGLLQLGVGMYRFEKDLDLGIGFYGTGGAISFDCTDPKVKTRFAISWLVPERGDPGFAVSANLSKYSSLKDFYEKTAGARKIDRLDINDRNDNIRIRGTAVPRNFPDDKNLDDLVFTVSVAS